MPDDWTYSLERDIEICEGQLALASVLPNHTTVYVNIEMERLRRLVKAAKSQLPLLVELDGERRE